jgi:hypothetical protein
MLLVRYVGLKLCIRGLSREALEPCMGVHGFDILWKHRAERRMRILQGATYVTRSLHRVHGSLFLCLEKSNLSTVFEARYRLNVTEALDKSQVVPVLSIEYPPPK